MSGTSAVFTKIQPQIICSGGVEVLWAAFKDYACKPYQINPRRLKQMQCWFDELYQRRARVGLDLSFHKIERIADLPSRLLDDRPKTFDAFCLNDQMFFSHDAAILTLPFALKENDPTNPHRFVGIWLHDFGKIRDKTRQLISNPTQARSYPKKQAPPDVRVIMDRVAHALGDKDLPGESSNIPAAPNSHNDWELRVQTFAYARGSERHQDSCSGIDVQRRAIIHSLWNTGTIYFLGNSDNIEVLCPPGATSSHLAKGVWHCAKLHPEGRAVLVTATQYGPKLIHNPWRISSHVPPALFA